MKTTVRESRIRVDSPRARRRQPRPKRVAARRSIRSRVRSTARVFGRRLDDLNRDVELQRKLRAGAPAVALGGALLGIFVNRWFFAIPIGVAGVLLQRPVRKWVPRILWVARVVRGYRAARERVRDAFRTAMTGP
jgi:hypothetical protein